MQERRLKYASLVANAVKLSNVADLTEVLSATSKEGTPRHLSRGRSCTTPHMRADSAGSLSTWTTCPTHSTRSHFLSRQPCDYFLHVSRTYALLRCDQQTG